MRDERQGHFGRESTGAAGGRELSGCSRRLRNPPAGGAFIQEEPPASPPRPPRPQRARVLLYAFRKQKSQVGNDRRNSSAGFSNATGATIDIA